MAVGHQVDCLIVSTQIVCIIFFWASTAGAPAVTKRLSLSLKERFGASCLGINELEPAPCSAAKPVDTPGGE